MPAAGAAVTQPVVLFTWGHLQVLQKLGEGSFGEVYRAFDPVLERDVALKLRRAEQPEGVVGRRAILDEARRLARVRHPNVLTVHGADVHDGRVGLWTDLISGQTLEERLRQDGPLGAHEAALICIELCDALAAVHAQGLTHGDVKAANIMRERGGRVVLMDFGAVTEVPRCGSGGGATLGTPLVMAPEVLRGETPGTTADLYSLGVLLYRLVSGRYPVEAESVQELCEKHARGESVPLADRRPDLPTAFLEVVDRALEVVSRGALLERRRDAEGPERLSRADAAGGGRAQARERWRRSDCRNPAQPWLPQAAPRTRCERGSGGAAGGARHAPHSAQSRPVPVWTAACRWTPPSSGKPPHEPSWCRREAPWRPGTVCSWRWSRGNRSTCTCSMRTIRGIDSCSFPWPAWTAPTRCRLACATASPGGAPGCPRHGRCRAPEAARRSSWSRPGSRCPTSRGSCGSFEPSDPDRRPVAGEVDDRMLPCCGASGVWLPPSASPLAGERALDRLAARLAALRSADGSVWVQQLELSNPGG